MSSELKELLEGATAFFAQKPERAATTSSVRCRLVGRTEALIENGKHRITADEPKFAGGTNAGPSPASFVLMALASCEAVTFRYWSERLEIPFETLEVEVEGAIDLRGALGFEGVRPGYTEVHISIQVAGSEPPERYREVLRMVDATCPVADMLTNHVTVKASVVCEQ